MKTFLLLLVSLMLGAGTAGAQTGAVCLFADPQGQSCTLNDPAPGLLSVYVVHTQAVGVTAISFSAPKPNCMLQAIWLSDTKPLAATVGDSQTGVSIGYGACLSSPIHVLTVNYFALGTTVPDCAYNVLPRPGSTHIETTDCDFNLLEAEGGRTFINSSLACECPSATPPGDPILGVTPSSLDFGEAAISLPIEISNLGGGTLTWHISESISWLSVKPTSGIQSGTVTATVTRSSLPNGTYTGPVYVISNAGTLSVSVTVQVTTNGAVLSVTPASLIFGAGESLKSVSIRNLGVGTLNWRVDPNESWFWADPATGINDGDVVVGINRQGLAAGSYNGILAVTSNGGTMSVPVSMTVNTESILSVDPTFLVFSSAVRSNTFTISNLGTGSLNWSLVADEPWIEIVPPLSGTGGASITVNVDPLDVPCCGVRTGRVIVDSDGGAAIVDVRATFEEPVSGGCIGIFADQEGISCNLSDRAPGLKTYYVVHLDTPVATACAYWAPKPACLSGTWVSDTNPFAVTIGNSQVGVSIGYGQCKSSPILVQSIAYMTTGGTPPCCQYPVLGIPTSGKVEAVDCVMNLVYATGEVATINSTSECRCSLVTVQETTWGRVKALYGD